MAAQMVLDLGEPRRRVKGHRNSTRQENPHKAVKVIDTPIGGGGPVFKIIGWALLIIKGNPKVFFIGSPKVVISILLFLAGFQNAGLGGGNNFLYIITILNKAPVC